MAPQIPPLDEQEFDQPLRLQDLPERSINFGNNTFWYFTSSPWFDPMCNNISIMGALGHDANGQLIMNDRKLWEERLKQQKQGVQYMVVGEPKEEGQPWVMQRQNKVHDPKDYSKINTYAEGTWYYQGTRVLMAPSMLDVVQSRLLSVATRMQQMAEISKNMTHWSPATGYSYYPPSYDVDTAKAATTASALGSPSLAPTDPDAAASQSQGGATTQAADPLAATTEFSDALFMQSLQMTNAYGDEYVDENPLKGEPGAFVFETTRKAVIERNKAQEQAAQAPPPAPAVPALKVDTQPPSAVPSRTGTPKIGTPIVEARSRKNSIAPVPKKAKNRRKSQGGLGSPTTPTVPQGSG